MYWWNIKIYIPLSTVTCRTTAVGLLDWIWYQGERKGAESPSWRRINAAPRTNWWARVSQMHSMVLSEILASRPGHKSQCDMHVHTWLLCVCVCVCVTMKRKCQTNGKHDIEGIPGVPQVSSSKHNAKKNTRARACVCVYVRVTMNRTWYAGSVASDTSDTVSKILKKKKERKKEKRQHEARFGYPLPSLRK